MDQASLLFTVFSSAGLTPDDIKMKFDTVTACLGDLLGRPWVML